MTRERCGLAQQKEQLLALSEQQRRDFARHAQGLVPTLRWVERGRRATRFARAHPLVFLPLILLSFRRLKRRLTWLGRGWLLKRLLARVARL